MAASFDISHGQQFSEHVWRNLLFSAHTAGLGPMLYILAMLLVWLEGDAALFAIGYLAHQGLLHPGLAFLWSLAGAVFGDIIWYSLGAFLQGKNGRLVRWLKKITNPLGPHLLARPGFSLFLSKFVYGLHHAILCKAGAMGIPLKTFVRKDFPGSLLWVATLGGVGYASSAGLAWANLAEHATTGFLVGIVSIWLLVKLVSFGTRTYFSKP